MGKVAKMVKDNRNQYTCKRCGYKWLSIREQNEINVCAKCHSPYWNKERVRPLNEK